MLLGEFHCTTNANGSLMLPPVFHNALSAGLTITRGMDRCLILYPAGGWQMLTTAVQERLRLTRSADRAFARLLFSGAAVCVPDENGCIPLPENLRRYADIRADAVIVGLYSHLELWDAQRWATLTTQMEADAALMREDYLLV